MCSRWRMASSGVSTFAGLRPEGAFFRNASGSGPGPYPLRAARLDGSPGAPGWRQVPMRPSLALILVAALAACSTVPAPDKCAYDKDALLALDEHAFDQDLANGGGGWRKIGNIPGCELAAAELISDYRAKHRTSNSIL